MRATLFAAKLDLAYKTFPHKVEFVNIVAHLLKVRNVKPEETSTAREQHGNNT
jgi:hypothetical protein